jgi:hypothetical protein
MWLVDRGGRQLGRQFQLGGRWGQLDNRVPKPHQQVQRGRMKIQSKKVSHEPVVAQAIGLQLSLQFLISVLAFASLGVLVVHRRG